MKVGTKDYALPALDKERLGQLIDLVTNIKVGDEASRAKDVLGPRNLSIGMRQWVDEFSVGAPPLSLGFSGG